jgi:hypothetical protein
VYNTSTGIISDAVGGNFAVHNTGGGSISEAKGGSFLINRAAGTISKGYGVFIGEVESTEAWSLYASDANAKSYFAGRVLIGVDPNTSATETLQVGGDMSLAAGKCVKITNGPELGTCPSDRRFKTAIRPIVGALDRLTALTPVNYHFRTEDFPERNFSNHRQHGLIAQDVEGIYPDLVSTDADGYKRVKYGNELMMQSIAAIKELRGELATRTKELHGELAAKDRMIEELKALVCVDHPTATRRAPGRLVPRPSEAA